jgi:hypothetical protein
MDLDRNGTLDINEFCAGMTEFDKSMTKAQAEVLFRHLDRDKGGTLDLSEFMEMSKKSMELSELLKHQDRERRPSNRDVAELMAKAKAKMMAAIEHNGVRLHRSASTCFDPKLQANLEMMTVRQMKKRLAVKESFLLQRTIKNWWDTMQLGGNEGSDTSDVMEKSTYVTISLALHLMFVPGE